MEASAAMGVRSALRREMPEYAPHILHHLEDLKGREVIIVGDVGLDEYVMGQVHRISPEAPVPVVDVEKEEVRLGLSANVAQNVASLGGVPRLISIVGNDAAANQLRDLLTKSGVSPEYLVVDTHRPTTRKLRVMVQHHHIVRVDYEQRQFLSEDVENAVLQKLRLTLPSAAAVVIQDYAKGVISERLVQEIVKESKAAGKKVLVDPYRSTPLKTYRGVDLIKPNYAEAVQLSGIIEDDLRKDALLLDRIGAKIMKEVGCSNLVVTLGKEGVRIFENDKVVELPTNAKQVFDVTGAGDTVIAALALAWGSGFTLEQSCALANFAAGVVVAKVGCVPCTIEELLEAVNEV